MSCGLRDAPTKTPMPRAWHVLLCCCNCRALMQQHKEVHICRQWKDSFVHFQMIGCNPSRHDVGIAVSALTVSFAYDMLRHGRSELKRRAVEMAMTRDELATQSAAAVRAQAEADRCEAYHATCRARCVKIACQSAALYTCANEGQGLCKAAFCACRTAAD